MSDKADKIIDLLQKLVELRAPAQGSASQQGEGQQSPQGQQEQQAPSSPPASAFRLPPLLVPAWAEKPLPRTKSDTYTRWRATENLLGAGGAFVPGAGQLAAQLRKVRQLSEAIEEFGKAFANAPKASEAPGIFQGPAAQRPLATGSQAQAPSAFRRPALPPRRFPALPNRVPRFKPLVAAAHRTARKLPALAREAFARVRRSFRPPVPAPMAHPTSPAPTPRPRIDPKEFEFEVDRDTWNEMKRKMEERGGQWPAFRPPATPTMALPSMPRPLALPSSPAPLALREGRRGDPEETGRSEAVELLRDIRDSLNKLEQQGTARDTGHMQPTGESASARERMAPPLVHALASSSSTGSSSSDSLVKHLAREAMIQGGKAALTALLG